MIPTPQGFSKVQSVDFGGSAQPKQTARYSTNPGVQATIENLLALGCPPIPVAPKQDPKLPYCHHQSYAIERFKPNPKQPEIQGEFCRISSTKVGDGSAPVRGRLLPS